MELIEALQQVIQDTNKGKTTDLQIGTVDSADPLAITVDTMMAPLQAGVLYLTEAVVEKKIPILEHKHEIKTLSHTHTVPEGGDTGTALDGTYETELALLQADIVCTEHGTALPVKDGYIILNRALEAGDRVLLLRVQNGQKFIVLSRVFEGGAV